MKSNRRATGQQSAGAPAVHRRLLPSVDAAAIAVAAFAALALAGAMPALLSLRGSALLAFAALTLPYLGALIAFGAYRPRNRERFPPPGLVGAMLGGGVVAAALAVLLPGALTIESVVLATTLGFTLSFFGRTFLEQSGSPPSPAHARGQRTLIIGSKDAARAVIRLVAQRATLPFHIVGCIDDDPDDRRVEGVRVLGALADLASIIAAQSIECVIIAGAVARQHIVLKVSAICARASAGNGKVIAVKVLPNLEDALLGRYNTSRIRDVRTDDLLGREPVSIDLSRVRPHLENRVVLVTGAGGSIGGELCRQIAALGPKQLILLGHGENALFSIQSELQTKEHFTRTTIVLADVADSARIRATFSTYRPHVVFHAAAHKHVPILETNICEAVRNNVFGTHVVALAAAAAGVAKFVMISTDKAVNPSSIMGATKRLAELICQSFERKTGTEFVSVRFGNVLGSRGSVSEIFQRQLEAGGPLTVTHPDMMRYFMTVSEAVSLVLEAMAIGRDGQVFVMDMGRPAKVLELAETIISLSGLKPYDDIDIVFTGIRPGEKLYEEILTSREYEDPTLSDRLFVAKQERLEYDRIASTLQALHLAVQSEDVPEVVAHLRELVPSFQPGEHLIKKSAIAKNGEPETPSPTDASIALTPVSGNGAAAGGAEPDAGPIVPAAIVHSAAPTKAR